MNIAKYIDHTLLKAEATVSDIVKLCDESIEHKFAAVCVNPVYVSLAAHRLLRTGVKVATVVGFPLGTNLPIVKAYEARTAILQKADEIDMVMNIGAAKAGQWQAVAEDIRQVVNTVQGNTVKVIIETSLLSYEEKCQACRVVLASGAQFVKTSTGFSSGGATVEDIKLIKSLVGDSLGIKASGGIRTKEQAEALILAGATRIGTSLGVELIK